MVMQLYDSAYFPIMGKIKRKSMKNKYNLFDVFLCEKYYGDFSNSVSFVKQINLLT